MATDFWKFTLRYSLALLGGLYIAIVALATYLLFFRINTGSALMSPLGYWGGLLYLVLLALAFFCWLYCIWRTWKLTEFDTAYRVASMAYLFGAPVLLYTLSIHIMLGILSLLGLWEPVR